MDTALREHYLNAIYHILPCNDFPEGYDIYIDDRHKHLDYWLDKNGFQSWIFITAWNPGSEQIPLLENLQRNKKLLSDINRMKLPVFDALGKAPDETWMEVSFWVPGLGQEKGKSLARKHGQNAFVFGAYETTRRN